jgi:hypothetical protein
MFQQASDRPTLACNDNGSYFRRRGQRTLLASGILDAAKQATGPICLSYVANGVFVISRQEGASGHQRPVRAA